MTVFGSKVAFWQLGTEPVEYSGTHSLQDCTICTEPLSLQHKDASPASLSKSYHPAVRIIACGHVHGKECLYAWLKVGHTCPTCKCLLFESTGDPVTQRDANIVMKLLGPMYGKRRVLVALSAFAQKQRKEQAALREIHEQQIAEQKLKIVQYGDHNGAFMLSSDDFLDSDGEVDFNMEDEDDEDSADYDEDEDLIEDEEDVGLIEDEEDDDQIEDEEEDSEWE